MLGVTADTNIYVSGLQFGGLPRRFLDFAAAGEFRLDISDAILKELLKVLREKFQWSAQQLHEAGEDVISYAQWITPAQSIDVISADQSDNKILECAMAAGSDFIVSGDTKHMLSLGSYHGIQIVKVADFLELLKRS